MMICTRCIGILHIEACIYGSIPACRPWLEYHQLPSEDTAPIASLEALNDSYFYSFFIADDTRVSLNIDRALILDF